MTAANYTIQMELISQMSTLTTKIAELSNQSATIGAEIFKLKTQPKSEHFSAPQIQQTSNTKGQSFPACSLSKTNGSTGMPRIKINNVNNVGPKCSVHALFLNQNVKFLLDSGSQVNTIPRMYVPDEIMKNLKPSEFNLTGYSNSTIKVFGLFETDISIENTKIEKITFFVVDNNRTPILGTPLFTKHNMAINLYKKHLDINKKQIPIEINFLGSTPSPAIKLLEKQKMSSISAFSPYKITLKPHHETTIYAITKEYNTANGFYIPEKAMKKQKFVVKESISSISNNTFLLTLANHTKNEITISRNTKIASLVHVQNVAEIHHTHATEAKFEKVIKELKINERKDLSPALKTKIQILVRNYISAFAIENEPLGHTDTAKYSIDTGNAPPVAMQRYRTPYYIRNELKKIIDKNVQTGLMEPCSSPWAAPVLLVKKPNGTWRLVCDYRRLNDVTIADQYPLPEIEDLITELEPSRFFSTADLFTGFHQIPCNDETKQKVAITTDFGQFTWSAMPMGGKNAPACFQRLMDNIFRSIPRSQLIIYLDDICAHAKTAEENLKILESMLQILVANKLKIRAAKTNLLEKRTTFCGYQVEEGWIKPNDKKIDAVKDLKIPNSTKTAQSLYGLLSYHRKFIKNFAQKTAPITATYRRNFQWTAEATKALNNIKNDICQTALKLKIPKTNSAKYVLETDASKDGFGACLFCCKRNNLHDHTHNENCLLPISYMSKQYTPAQINYFTMEKELMAGKLAMQKWAQYLRGHEFIWYTDNACVKWAQKTKGRKLKIAQWMSEMEEFNFKVILQKSKQMKISDCLSRQFSTNAIKITRPDLTALQENDQLLHQIRNFVSIDRWPNQPNHEIKEFSKIREKLKFGRSGELIIIGDNNVQTVVPESIKYDVLKNYHDKNGHPGQAQTFQQISQAYYWPRIRNDINEFISTCEKCQKNKPHQHPNIPPMGESETPNGPFELFALDLIGPLPITTNDEKYALTMVDHFSKRIYAFPLTSKYPEPIYRLVKQTILRNPRMPKKIITDNGGEFALIPKLTNEFGIIHTKTPPYHPATNGEIEVMNRTIKSRLYAKCEMNEWSDHIDEVIHQMNSSKSTNTGFSPYQIENGIDGKNPFDEIEQFGKQQRQQQISHEMIKRKLILEKHERLNKFGNEKFTKLANGDKVLIKNMIEKHPKYIGPFTVIRERAEGNSYELENHNNGHIIIRNARHIKPFKMRKQIPETYNYNSDSENNDTDTKTTNHTNITLYDIENSTNFILDNNNSTAMPEPEINSEPDPETNSEPEPENLHPETLEDVRSLRSEITDESSLDNMSVHTDTFSYSESTPSTEATADQKIKVKLRELTISLMRDIATDYDFELQDGTKTELSNQIKSWFAANKPNHEKRGKELVFEIPMRFIHTKILTELTKIELQLVIKNFKLPEPQSVYYNTKATLIKHINQFMSIKYPNHKRDHNNVLVFGPTRN